MLSMHKKVVSQCTLSTKYIHDMLRKAYRDTFFCFRDKISSYCPPRLLTTTYFVLLRLYECFSGYNNRVSRDAGVGEDTALAWLMPTNTAMQRITLAHSLLNLCGSPSWLSKHGYNRPTTAGETEIRHVRKLLCIYPNIQ